MIAQEELERSLNGEERWGFRKETDDPEYLGWILLSKRKSPTVWEIDQIENIVVESLTPLPAS
jgi:hypothetical protein